MTTLANLLQFPFSIIWKCKSYAVAHHHYVCHFHKSEAQICEVDVKGLQFSSHTLGLRAQHFSAQPSLTKG